MSIVQQLTLEVAGLSMELSYDRPEPQLFYRGGTGFEKSSTAADPALHLTLGLTESIQLPSYGNPVFDSGNSLVFSNRNTSEYIWRYPGKPDFYHRRLMFDSAVSRGTLEFAEGAVDLSERWHPLDFPVDQLLFMLLLGRSKGVLLHASGLTHEGRGYLFAGVSGSGKSTMSRLWRKRSGVEQFSDDRCAVRREEGEYYFYGTPWGGEEGIATPGRARLEALFALEKSESVSFERLSSAEAATRLFECSFPALWDKNALNVHMDFILDLISAVPVVLLRFPVSEEAVDRVCSLDLAELA